MRTLLFLIMLSVSLLTFAQSYEIDAYNGQTISTCSGAVYDSDQSGDYSNNEDYSITICSANAGEQIQIVFEFITELNFDYLDVYDGTSTSAPYLGRIWGDYSAGTITEPIVAVSKNSTGCLHLVWHSDGSVVYAGFAGSLSCVPSASGSPTEQDCLGAIPICGNSYETTESYSGSGSDPYEINGVSSCLSSGEINNVWYVFTAQQTDDITFSLIPKSSSDDYDWAVYDLTSSDCSQIACDPSLEISCDYSGSVTNNGITGPNNGSEDQDEPMFNVTAGNTYVINVSNFSSTQNGYTIDFNISTASSLETTKSF